MHLDVSAELRTSHSPALAPTVLRPLGGMIGHRVCLTGAKLGRRWPGGGAPSARRTGVRCHIVGEADAVDQLLSMTSQCSRLCCPPHTDHPLWVDYDIAPLKECVAAEHAQQHCRTGELKPFAVCEESPREYVCGHEKPGW